LFAVETHTAVFRWVLKILAEEGLVEGKTVSMDATTLEANAALRSLVRRYNGQKYDEYLKGLAQAAGIENPTRMHVNGHGAAVGFSVGEDQPQAPLLAPCAGV
jgi:hypothetical protein